MDLFTTTLTGASPITATYVDKSGGGTVQDFIDSDGIQPVQERLNTSFTLTAEDRGSLVQVKNSVAVAITVPSEITEPDFPVGGYINFVQSGSAAATFVADAGVTIRSRGNRFRTNGIWSYVTLQKIGPLLWLLSGDTAV